MQQDNQAAEAELQAALKGQDAAKREHDILSKKHQTALQNLKVGMPDCSITVSALDISSRNSNGRGCIKYSTAVLDTKLLYSTIPGHTHLDLQFPLSLHRFMHWRSGLHASKTSQTTMVHQACLGIRAKSEPSTSLMGHYDSA